MTRKTKETKETRKRWLFLGWSYSRRSEDIAIIMGIEYFYFPLSQRIRFFQFPLLFIKTLLFLSKKRPEVIFIQHPPVHAILPVFLYCLFTKTQFIIDSHIIPGTTITEKPHHHIYLLLHRFYSYYAAVTLFHSDVILKRFKRWRCRCMVLENPVRNLEIKGNFPVRERPAVGMVSSFSPDEHILDVIESAKKLKDVYFYITGKKNKIPPGLVKSAAENICFTGYIKGDDYYEFLKSMDTVIVLTDREESALLGAYETISCGTPLVLSDTWIMRYYFPIGAIFVENRKEAIGKGIRKALEENEKLRREMRELKGEKIEKQAENFLRIKNLTS